MSLSIRLFLVLVPGGVCGGVVMCGAGGMTAHTQPCVHSYLKQSPRGKLPATTTTTYDYLVWDE